MIASLGLGCGAVAIDRLRASIDELLRDDGLIMLFCKV